MKLKLAGYRHETAPKRHGNTSSTQRVLSKQFILNFFSTFRIVMNDRYIRIKFLYLRCVVFCYTTKIHGSIELAIPVACLTKLRNDNKLVFCKTKSCFTAELIFKPFKRVIVSFDVSEICLAIHWNAMTVFLGT